MTCKSDISAILDDIDSLDADTRKQVDKKIKKVTDNPEIGDRKHGWPQNIRVVPVFNHRYVLAYRYILEPECIVTFILFNRHDELYSQMDKLYKRT